MQQRKEKARGASPRLTAKMSTDAATRPPSRSRFPPPPGFSSGTK